MKNQSIILLLCFIFLLGCVDTEIIDEEKKIKTLVIEFPTNVMFNKNPSSFDKCNNLLRPYSGEYKMEFLYEVYDGNNNLLSKHSRTLNINDVFQAKREYHLDIYSTHESKDYNILMLLYFVNSNNENRLYTIKSLREVEIDSIHFNTNTILKEIYTGLIKIDDELNHRDTLSVELHSPYAHYKIWTNDLYQYLKETGKDENDSILLRIRYPEYYLSAYDIYRQEPIRAKTGLFVDKWIRLNDSLLIFDYLFVQGDTSKTKVKFDIMKNENCDSVESSYRPIEISYTKNEVVQFRENFLTSFKETGIVINPDFDGEFNITL